MNKREKAFYDKLPASLSRKEKLEFMSKWGVKFAMFPKPTQEKFIRQAYRDRSSQFIVKHKGKLISVPQGNVLVVLERLGIEVQAECILLG
jgi:hypothetical protein